MDWEAESQRALEFVRAGDLEGALSTHDRVVAANPENGYFRFRRGEALALAGRHEEALADTLFAARFDPAFSLFRHRALSGLFALRPPEEAIAVYRNLGPSLSEQEGLDQYAACLLIQHGAFSLCTAEFRTVLGANAIGVERAEEDFGPHTIKVRFSEAGHLIKLSAGFINWPFMIERVLAYCAYFDRIQGVNGDVLISVGDCADGDAPQLCASSDRPHHYAIPDPIFVATGGYGTQRAKFASAAMPWAARKPIAFWRGSLTGQASSLEQVFALPRVRLCLASRFSAAIDAKITVVQQFSDYGAVLMDCLRGLGVLGEFQDETANLAFRYLIDVDGNTNAWQSLYTKLLAQGCVIKVRSRYRQWYYDRLTHRGNVFFVDDPGEIAEAVAALERSGAGESIAAEGRRTGLAMTLQTEHVAFAGAVREYLRHA